MTPARLIAALSCVLSAVCVLCAESAPGVPHHDELIHTATAQQEGGRYYISLEVKNVGKRRVLFTLPPGTPMVPKAKKGVPLLLLSGVDLDLVPGASEKKTLQCVPMEQKGGSTEVGADYEPSHNRTCFLSGVRAVMASEKLKDKLRFQLPGDSEGGRILSLRWAITELREDGWGLSPEMKLAAEKEVLRAFGEKQGEAAGALPAFWADIEATLRVTRLNGIDVQLGSDRVVFDNTNIAGVLQGGAPAVFKLERPTLITVIRTYHWNNGKGSPQATWICLKGNEQHVYQARAEEPPTWWKARPMVLLRPGRYRVADGEPESWAHNAGSKGIGFVQILGQPLDP